MAETSFSVFDPPVGPHADTAAIHAWLDEFEELRREHQGSPTALAAIERGIERVVGWLQGREALSGADGPMSDA